jgi:nucleoside phosphorylase
MFQRTLSREDYTVGIICALEFEKEAVEATLDEKHGMVQRTPGDNNDYAFGKMGEHNVVIACLPASVMSPSAAVAKVMMCSFPIKIGFVVGVGDGVWTEVHDIRLGDLVVSRPDDGMVQWDYGKTEESGRLWRTGKLRRPPQPLLQMLRYTQNDGELGMILEAALAEHPLPRDEIGHQGLRHNEFFEASYEHTGGETCTNCDRSRLVRHRPHRTNLNSRVYHSKIGSSIEVLERGPMRDHIAREEGMLCFETEAAGLPDTFPCLVIRGVCSYADSHTNTRWQGYAAMAAAAAYAKCLLLCVLREGLATIPLASENTGRNRRITCRSSCLADAHCRISNFKAGRMPSDSE